MIGPWTLGDNSHERYPHVWYRLDILNSAPMSAFDVIAEVWPRGASGYGWAVTLSDGRKVEGESRDALAGDEENLRRCKAAADKVVAMNYGGLADEFAAMDRQELRPEPSPVSDPLIRRVLFGPEQAETPPLRLAADAVPFDAAASGREPLSGTLPDVRDMPLADRRAVFLDGLRALTQMTGVVAVGLHEDMDEIALADIAEAGAGTYERPDQEAWIVWTDAATSDRQAYDRKVHALKMNLREMRVILATREQHNVTRGVDGLRADISAAEAELRTLEAK